MRTPLAFDQPAVAGRIARLEAEHDEAGAASEPFAQGAERLRGEQRNVGVGDEDVVEAARDRGARRERRMGGALAFVLHEDFRVRRAFQRRGGDVVAVRPDDDRDSLRAGAGERLQRMGEHGPPGDLVQRLGPRRAHAHALPRRQGYSQTGPARRRARRKLCVHRPFLSSVGSNRPSAAAARAPRLRPASAYQGFVNQSKKRLASAPE